MLRLWADNALRTENDKLRIALEAKILECDLQGEVIETLHKHVRELLALQTQRGRALGEPLEIKP